MSFTMWNLLGEAGTSSPVLAGAGTITAEIVDIRFIQKDWKIAQMGKIFPRLTMRLTHEPEIELDTSV